MKLCTFSGHRSSQWLSSWSSSQGDSMRLLFPLPRFYVPGPFNFIFSKSSLYLFLVLSLAKDCPVRTRGTNCVPCSLSQTIAACCRVGRPWNINVVQNIGSWSKLLLGGKRDLACIKSWQKSEFVFLLVFCCWTEYIAKNVPGSFVCLYVCSPGSGFCCLFVLFRFVCLLVCFFSLLFSEWKGVVKTGLDCLNFFLSFFPLLTVVSVQNCESAFQYLRFRDVCLELL